LNQYHAAPPANRNAVPAVRKRNVRDDGAMTMSRARVPIAAARSPRDRAAKYATTRRQPPPRSHHETTPDHDGSARGKQVRHGHETEQDE
jgi:hypothetical protein